MAYVCPEIAFSSLACLLLIAECSQVVFNEVRKCLCFPIWDAKQQISVYNVSACILLLNKEQNRDNIEELLKQQVPTFQADL